MLKIGIVSHAKKKPVLLMRELEKKGDLNVHTYFTENREHGIELTQNAISEGCDRIIAVGGDGTFNEVVNGVLTSIRADTPCLFFPNGTANDWCRSYPAPETIEQLTDRLLGEAKPVDIGYLTFQSSEGKRVNRYFLNIADAGMGAAVVRKVNERPKWFGAGFTFKRAILETFFSYSNVRLICESDDFKYDGVVRSFVVANGKYFGSGLCIAPHASIKDGKLAVAIIGDVSVLDYLRYLPALRKGDLIDHPEVHYFQAADITVTSPGRLDLEADGEFLGFAPLKFSVVPSGLMVL